ncbi:MAG: hypothetical protein OXL34_13840 [Gemmatimonadota bacterium]|nr:hypothetical protein [Gemmatimonadota bacterium]
MSAQSAAGSRFPVKVAVALVLACGTEPKPNIDGVWTGVTEDRTDPWTLEITDSNDRLRGTYTTRNPDPSPLSSDSTISGGITGGYGHPSVTMSLVIPFHGTSLHWDCDYVATVDADRDSMSGTVTCYLTYIHVFSDPLVLHRR